MCVMVVEAGNDGGGAVDGIAIMTAVVECMCFQIIPNHAGNYKATTQEIVE